MFFVQVGGSLFFCGRCAVGTDLVLIGSLWTFVIWIGLDSIGLDRIGLDWIGPLFDVIGWEETSSDLSFFLLLGISGVISSRHTDAAFTTSTHGQHFHSKEASETEVF